MKRFVEGVDRGQGTLFPERLDDYIGEDNPLRETKCLAPTLIFFCPSKFSGFFWRT